MSKVFLYFESCQCEIEIYNTPTGNKIINSLPLECSVNTWGEEIYFSIALSLPLEPDARSKTKIGEVGYWPNGKAFCIFFGPTPASTGNEPQAVSPVNIFGKIVNPHDVQNLKKVKNGEKVRVVKSKELLN